MNASTNDSEILQTLDKDVIVVANAGAGKTTLLVKYYFELLGAGFDPASIITFTFTEKAANQLHDRILDLLPKHPEFSELPLDLLQEFKKKILNSPIGTIHQFCLRIIREAQAPDKTLHLKIIDPASEIQLQERVLQRKLKESFLAEEPGVLLLLKTFGIRDLKTLVREFLAQIPHRFSEAPPLPSPSEDESRLLEALSLLGRSAYAEIQEEKRRLGWINFDDMEHQALELIQNPTPFLKKKLPLFSHALVDEFQDTSPVQIQLLEALQEQVKRLKGCLRLFCVGDPKQSIYRFRKVDNALIKKTEEKILRGGGKQFESVKNYRSTLEIVTLVNLFTQSAFPSAVPSEPTLPSGQAGRPQLIPLNLEEDRSRAEDYRQQEARWVSSEIQKFLDGGTKPEKISVLFRSSASSLPLLRELKNRRIPYTTRGGQDLFERQEILDLKRLLFFLDNPADNVSLVGILRSPLFLISDATLFYLSLQTEKKDLFAYLQSGAYRDELKDRRPDESEKLSWALGVLERWLQLTRNLPASRLLAELAHGLDLPALSTLASQDTSAALAIEQFLDWLRQIEAENAPLSLSRTVEFLKNLRNLPHFKTPLSNLIEDKNCVQLSTIHAAKGLENDVVFVIDLERQAPRSIGHLQHIGTAFSLRYPDENGIKVESERFAAIQKFHSQEEEEENNRLLYVALTRAKRHLLIPLHLKARGNSNLQKLLLKNLGEKAENYFVVPEFLVETTTQEIRPAIEWELLKPEALTSKMLGQQDLTVSELETFQVCPLKHHYLYRLKIPDSTWEAPDEIGPAETGTLFHQALRRLHAHPEETARLAFERLYFNVNPAPPTETLELWAQTLQSYLDCPAAEILRSAQEDYSELPFLLQVEQAWIRGQIDRLLKGSEAWTLIDFKYVSKPLSARELRETYGFQLKTYVLAAQKILRGETPRAQIHLLAQRKTVDLHFQKDELAEHGELIREIMQKMLRYPLEQTKFRPACHSCILNQKIPVCPIPRGQAWRSGIGSFLA